MTDSSPDAPLRCAQVAQPASALGAAVDLLRLREPFAHYRFGSFASVLKGQVRRGHYVMTFKGRRIVGYAGWALCDEKTAMAWIEHNRVPKYEECLAGDYWVGLTFYAESRDVTVFQARYCRNLYPNHRVVFLRDYGDRERFFKTFNRAGDRAGGGGPRS